MGPHGRSSSRDVGSPLRPVLQLPLLAREARARVHRSHGEVLGHRTCDLRWACGCGGRQAGGGPQNTTESHCRIQKWGWRGPYSPCNMAWSQAGAAPPWRVHLLWRTHSPIQEAAASALAIHATGSEWRQRCPPSSVGRRSRPGTQAATATAAPPVKGGITSSAGALAALMCTNEGHRAECGCLRGALSVTAHEGCARAYLPEILELTPRAVSG